MAPTLPTRALGAKLKGKKKALSVSVSYAKLAEKWPDEELHLPNAHKDSFAIRDMLVDLYGYEPDDIKIMMDNSDKYEEPTMKNMRKAMKALVHGAQPGDHFVFHFSGHGSQVVNLDNTEDDGYDEVIWPVDVSVRKGKDSEMKVRKYIIDDDLKKILVDSLPEGTRMTVILDCCHSGTAVDLPFTYSDDSHDEEWSMSPTALSPIDHDGYEGPFSPARGMSIETITSRTAKTRVLSTGSQLANREFRGLKRSMCMPYAARGQTLSCGLDKDLKTEIQKNNRFVGVDNAFLDKHATSWSACLDGQLIFDGSKGGILIQSLVKLLKQQKNRTHRDLLMALSQELFNVARRARHAWIRHPETSHLAKTFALPKPSIGSLRPVDEIFELPFVL